MCPFKSISLGATVIIRLQLHTGFIGSVYEPWFLNFVQVDLPQHQCRSAEVIDNILHISGIAVPGLEIPQETIMEKEPLADGGVGSGDLISFSKGS